MVVKKNGMGWIPDFPDYRDFTIQKVINLKKTDKAKSKSKKRTLASKAPKARSTSSKIGLKYTEETIAKYNTDQIRYNEDLKDRFVDLIGMLDDLQLEEILKSEPKGENSLISNFSPIENQGNLQSCTAHAGVGLIEYYEKTAFNKFIDASRLFLYKTTRNLLEYDADVGATMKATMAAIRIFGVVPEKYWLYDEEKVDEEPSSFCYSYAKEFQAIRYFRIDSPEIDNESTLKRIKCLIDAKIPCMFGCSMFESVRWDKTSESGNIPYPLSFENLEGGHALIVVGYDDEREIQRGGGYYKDEQMDKGALLVRNSWGEKWGLGGYGYLPYKYVRDGLATDFWSILQKEWIDTGKFGV